MMPAMMEVKINRNSQKHYTVLQEESFFCLIDISTDMEPCCTARSFSPYFLVCECMVIVPIIALITHGWYLN